MLNQHAEAARGIQPPTEIRRELAVELLESVALQPECAGPFTLPRVAVSPTTAALVEPIWQFAES